ncbi:MULTISPECIES: hypothetical protein [unclassified Roseibium]|nr:MULTISPECIES: hypothetical protein [unclassified Roseibium]
MSEAKNGARTGGRYCRDPETGELKKLKPDELPVAVANGKAEPRKRGKET